MCRRYIFPQEVDEPDEEILIIFENLEIRDDPFDMNEYRKVKASLKLGEAAGPDEILPEGPLHIQPAQTWALLMIYENCCMTICFCFMIKTF